MSESRPVLIVGAGPTGMTAAMELSRFGVPVRIVDKLPTPSTTSRAVAVQARTLELFEQRGLSEEMLRLGNRANATAIHGNGKLLGKVQLGEIKSRYNFILLLSQAETERILREQLARQGVSIERGTEMIAFAQTEAASHSGRGGGVKAVLRHPDGALEEFEAAFLVCAEGAHSTVRHTMSLPFEGKSLSESYALADLHLDGDLPDDEISIFTIQHGLLAIFPLGNRRFRLIATDPQKHGRDAGDPTLEELQRLYDADTHIPARLHDMNWSSRFWINSRMLHALRVGNVFFGGDSAHIHSPAGGQGMNTGIQDMINLGWKLALVWQGKAAPELLDTYGEDRLPVIRHVVTGTETATDMFNSQNAVVHQLITHLAPMLLGTRFMQKTGTGIISEVAANYRSSPLSRTSRAPGRLRAGDRLPDLDVLAWNGDSPGDGQPRDARLYELLDPSRGTLLIAANANAPVPVPGLEPSLQPWQDILRTQRIAARAADPGASASFDQLFGADQSLLLVRPDSYLGFIGDLPTLVEWLRQWFPFAAERRGRS